jgi:hypothetical protein
MACFTDIPYRDRTYPFLVTIATAAELTPVSFGCYDAMNDAHRLYQFYIAFATLGGIEEPMTENCFVQITEADQYNHVNEALAAALTPAPIV